AVLVLDSETQIQYANRSVERLFGYTPQELVKQPLEVLLSEENDKKRRTLVDSWLASARRGWHATTLPARRPDGKPFEYSLTIGRVETPLGGVYTAIVRDTSPIQDITQRLDSASAYIEALLTLSPFPVEVYSPDGKWERGNAARQRLLGPPPTSDYRLADDPFWLTKGVREVVLRAFQGETVQIGPYWYEPPVPGAPDGGHGRRPSERVSLLTTFIAVPDISGKVQHVVAVHENVTSTARVEEALQAIQAQHSETVAPFKSAVQEAESRLQKERDRLEKLLEQKDSQHASEAARSEAALNAEKERAGAALRKMESDHAATLKSLHAQFETDKTRLDAALRAAGTRRETLERELKEAEKIAQTSVGSAKSDQERAIQQLKVELHATQLKVNALTLQWQGKLEAVMSDLQDGVIVFDLKPRDIKYANVAAAQMLGYSPSEMVGKPLDALYAEAELESLFKKGLLRKLKSHGSQMVNLALHRKSGEEFDPDQLLIPLKEDANTLTEGVLVIRDAPSADQVGEIQDALRQAESRALDLTDQVDALKKSMAAAEAQYQYNREQIEGSFKNAVAERDAEIQRLNELFRNFDSERATLQGETQGLQKRLRAAEDQARQAQSAHQTAEEKASAHVRQLSDELKSLRQSLKDAQGSQDTQT
ncbi:MAG: PAS domain S-box protein, partial [bacterium]